MTGVEELVRILTIAIIIGIILAMFIAFCICMFKYARRYTLGKLEYKRYFSEEGAYEGNEIFLIEELSNHSFLPMFNIDIESHVTSNIKLSGCYHTDAINQDFISSFFVMPYTRIKRKHKATCIKRGFYTLETAKINVGGEEVFIDSRAELYIYPKEMKIEDERSVNLYLQYSEASTVPLISDPFSFSGVREYMPGDTFDNINFKASARHGKLMSNERDFMLGKKTMVYVNFQMPEEYISLIQFEEMMETGLSFAAYIIDNAIENGQMTAYSANSRMTNGERYIRIEHSTGMHHQIEIMKSLAKSRVIYGNSISSVIDMDINEFMTGTQVYFITTYMDSAIDERIATLNRTGNNVKIILIEPLQEDA